MLFFIQQFRVQNRVTKLRSREKESERGGERYHKRPSRCSVLPVVLQLNNISSTFQRCRRIDLQPIDDKNCSNRDRLKSAEKGWRKLRFVFELLLSSVASIDRVHETRLQKAPLRRCRRRRVL